MACRRCGETMGWCDLPQCPRRVGRSANAPPQLSDAGLIEKMRDLKTEMLYVAQLLYVRGSIDHGVELRGAADILQTWITGIGAAVDDSANLHKKPVDETRKLHKRGVR